ncbi:MFS transporter [Winogradskyella sp. 3972H.M.0a.05]|uniref:NTP/NDP exchange transporter n=1 Tax=Winogradskyella sp. 3972H.M.0a.05 TaxID=2950277 RepID=UPI00339A86FE
MNLFKKQLKFKSIDQSEMPAMLWSMLFFALLMASYAILRPIRNEMGIINGVSSLHWLFTATFLATALFAPFFGFIASKIGFEELLTKVYIFFLLNIFAFYVLFKANVFSDILPSVFFIWLSIFSLYTISLFWSLMLNIYSNAQSKRLFGIISAGGSLGSLLGSFVITPLSFILNFESFLLLSALFLFLAFISLKKLLKYQRLESLSEDNNHRRFQNSFFKKARIRESFKQILSSKYIIGVLLFVFFYTAISTFIYFEQANLVDQTIVTSKERIGYFSSVDLIVNSLAIFGQLYISNKIFSRYELYKILSIVPIVIAVGLILLSIHTTLYVIALLMIFYRLSNLILLRPGREMLFAIKKRKNSHITKSFIDTSVYRAGDFASGWFFTLCISIGFGLSAIAIIIIPFILVWGYLGYKIGKKHIQLVKSISTK